MAREAHFKQLFTSLKNKPAKFWRLINDICGRSTKKAVIPDRLSLERVELSHPQTVVDALNEHFASVGRKTTSILGDHLPVSDSIASLWDPSGRTFSLRPVEPHEMYHAVKSVKTDFGNSLESVPSRLLADFLVFLSEPLAVVYNLSVTSGVFPEDLKVVSVVPLYKKGKGSKSDPGKYTTRDRQAINDS